MQSLRIITLATALLSTLLTANAQCGSMCKFRTCIPNTLGNPKPVGGRTFLRAPGVSLSGFVCRQDISLGRVISTGEALVDVDGTMVPISDYNPPSLSVPFRPAQFGLYPIPFLDGLKGIGRRRSRGNQEGFLDNLCVVLPITEYTVLGEDGRVLERVLTDDEDSCVSFRTRTAEVLVDLTWSGSDDFDIKVITPGGAVIDKNNPTTPDAKLSETDKGNACDERLAGKETVAIFKPLRAERGDYTVHITQNKNCGEGPSDWELRFTVNERLLQKRTGSASLADGSTVNVFQFTV